MSRPDRLPRRLWAALAMVVGNIGLVVVLLGAAGSLAQHDRVLDQDTLRACVAAALDDPSGWGYEYGEVAFDGPNTIRVDFADVSSTGRGAEAAAARCTVAAGEEVGSPLIIRRAELVPPAEGSDR